MRVAAIVPAFNEEASIAPVLKVLLGIPEIHETIVVDDGSSDRTAEVSARLGARVIRLLKNAGKGGAMKAGAAATSADVLLFLDADLIGLKPEHIRTLLRPVESGEAEMVLGVFAEGRLATDLAQKITPFLSGQRVIKKAVLEEIPDLEDSRYGVEVAITRYCRRKGVRTTTVFLPDLSQIMKEEKRGFFRGFAHRMQMYWEIVKAIRFI